ncbi:MAG: CotH kinase family protein [Clostridium sp.]|nr:CotH kinase family protein [Clostridium sp.]
MKARGNASFNAPRYKKSYTLRLEEETGLSGMPKGREWVLLAHYYDDTHLRDYLTFDMARVLDMAYVPEGEFVNLYIEGEFQGIYFLCQKIEISPEKVAVTNLEQQTLEKMPKEALARYPYAREGTRGGQEVIVEKGYAAGDDSFDITGGYLLELEWLKDRYNEEKSGFTSDANQCVVIKSPEYATSNEVSYIKNRYQELEDAIGRSIAEGSDEYLAYMDLDSFVKKYLVEEVSKNMDANLSSQYIYKDSDAIDSKFYAGPVWDYDRAYDNKVGDVNNRGAAMFWVNQGSAGFDFWKKLYETKVFQKRVQEIYSEKLSPVLTDYADNKLWEWETQIHDSIIADMFRYRSEYEEEMDEEVRLSAEMRALTGFIGERKAFLDNQWITK